MNEILQNAINHFGELESDSMLHIILDDTKMKHSGGGIQVGTTNINPKNHTSPNRIIIDSDPEYPHILIRAIKREMTRKNQ